MTNIIKTAIITIIISFISGLMLEYYKNLAPRILCNIKNAMPILINNRKIRAYIITISNVSNKTIHDLTLYVQSPHTTLGITDAKITKGLKFDSSIEDNILDVYIPFLSKDDKFSVTVYAENQPEMLNKPVIILRSPENFKQIDSLDQNGVLSLLLNIPKSVNQAFSKSIKKPEASIPNKNNDFTMVMDKPLELMKQKNKVNRKTFHGNKRPNIIKKVMITVASIILLVFVGVLGKSYFKEMSTNASTPDVKTTVPNQSSGETGSSGTSKNKSSKVSNGKTSSKTLNKETNESTGSKASNKEANENIDSKASNVDTTGNTDPKTSNSEVISNTDSKASNGGTTSSTDSKASNGEATGNTGSKTSNSGAISNTDSKASNGGTTSNTDSKASTNN